MKNKTPCLKKITGIVFTTHQNLELATLKVANSTHRDDYQDFFILLYTLQPLPSDFNTILVSAFSSVT